MSEFSKKDNELLHRMCETYDVDPMPGRRFAGYVSRIIRRQEETISGQEDMIAQIVKYLTSGFCVCTCAKCYGAEHLKSFKCPREILLQKLKVTRG